MTETSKDTGSAAVDVPTAEPLEARLARAYTFGEVSEEQTDRMNRLRAKAHELSLVYTELCPRSRELAEALTCLETASMYAVKAVAIN